MSDAGLGGRPLWTLIPIAAIYGVAAVFIFRRLSNASLVRISVNRILAYVMELGLFLDSPSLVLRAQLNLLRENIRLLRLVIVPAGILALFFALLFLPMTSLYGRAPLAIGEPSVVTLQMRNAVMPAIQLDAPANIAVETPPVRVLRDHQISWRIRPLRQGSNQLRFRLQDRILSPSPFLHDPVVRSIEIGYPKTTILGLPWLAWFLMISIISTVIAGLC